MFDGCLTEIVRKGLNYFGDGRNAIQNQTTYVSPANPPIPCCGKEGIFMLVDFVKCSFGSQSDPDPYTWPPMDQTILSYDL